MNDASFHVILFSIFYQINYLLRSLYHETLLFYAQYFYAVRWVLDFNFELNCITQNVTDAAGYNTATRRMRLTCFYPQSLYLIIIIILFYTIRGIIIVCRRIMVTCVLPIISILTNTKINSNVIRCVAYSRISKNIHTQCNMFTNFYYSARRLLIFNIIFEGIRVRRMSDKLLYK
jgi:hypothetical protein